MLDEAEIAAILASAVSLEAAAIDLVRAANAAGGRDNVTVVLTAPPAVESRLAA
jgi:protein phosphatase